MIRPSYGDGAPIAAVATALAESALSIVRTGGPGSIELASRVFSRPKALRDAEPNSAVHGWIVDKDDERIDEVVAVVFRAPSSFTGEDAVEFMCHGGIAVSKAVLGALLETGFREALHGEFSFRAFMNGKLDLTRAESIMELVGAKTDEARGRAVERLSGALEREIDATKELLVGTLAATEILLDYSEDDGVGEDEAGILPDRESVLAAQDRLRALAAGYRVERLYREGATVAVAGRPNAGKSSLFNRLVKEERSIVSDTPGTTRDWIEAWVSIEGIPVRLVDTAGLRSADDPVERAGVERSVALLKGADVTLYIVDGTEGETPEDAAFKEGKRSEPFISVWNKIDAGAAPIPGGYFGVSAETGEGIAELAAEIARRLKAPAAGTAGDGGQAGGAAVGIASARQKVLVDRALAAVEEALRRADAGLALDLIAPELREAVDALGEITGEVSAEDVLENMFGRFCVGK